MTFKNAFIPHGAYWSSPFCRWQGSLASSSSLELLASTARRFFAERSLDDSLLDSLALGFTVPQKHSFYGAPWVAGMMGAAHLTGPVLNQACATSARVLASSAGEIETGRSAGVLSLTCDRTSNGPMMVYPSPKAPGGTLDSENWVMDNFNLDPHAGNAMIDTAENVARSAGIGREEQDELTLLRHSQYDAALADERAFQRKWMFPIELASRRKTTVIDADEGVHPTTAEGLAKLRPVLPDGSVTFGSQTHPADGNAGIIVTNEERAAELARDPQIKIQLHSFGQARVEAGHMPMAVVPAARQAAELAGVAITKMTAIKTHNPFAVNDIYFSRETGVEVERMNAYGSSLIYGHPQGPTGMRGIVELIEELIERGGGHGLFTGCAAGDSAMALVLSVS